MANCMVSNNWSNYCGLSFVVIIIVIGLLVCGLLICELSFQRVEMSFTCICSELTTLKRSELVALENHYKLEVNSGMQK